MNEIWVLTVKTSLPETCNTYDEMTTEVSAFDSFEKGKNSLRQKLKDFAFSENAMFNGEGKIKYFAKYVEETLELDLQCGCVAKENKVFSKIQDTLTTVFQGEDTDLDVELDTYADYMIGVTVKENEISFCGYEDGPINGYYPTLATNLFSMKEEKNYYLYIDDRFGQDDATSELYIDLVKTEVC